MSQTVAAFMLDRLRQWGVTRIYGYPGDGINGLLGAFHEFEDDIEFVQTRHEEIAALCRLRARQADRRGRGVHGHLRPRRHPPAQRAL